MGRENKLRARQMLEINLLINRVESKLDLLARQNAPSNRIQKGQLILEHLQMALRCVNNSAYEELRSPVLALQEYGFTFSQDIMVYISDQDIGIHGF